MQNVIDKIKKLLALSQSSNANEAAVAAATAQRLMAEHSIAAAELVGAIEEKASKEVDPLFAAKALPLWLNILSCGLCKANGVYSWAERCADGVTRIYLAGRPSDVANARFLFAYLRSEIERLAQVECPRMGRSIKDAYRKGAAIGALDAMKKVTEEVRATATCAALLKVDGRLADARSAAALRGKTTTRNAAVRGDRSAFERGKAAGSHLHGSAQIGAAGGRMLGS
jgi:hypothetical protein